MKRFIHMLSAWSCLLALLLLVLTLIGVTGKFFLSAWKWILG